MDLDKSQKLMLFKFSAYGFLKNLQFFEPFLLLFFTIEKGLSYTEFGMLVAIREIAVYLLEIPSGIIADVTGRRRAMVIAFSSYLLSFAIFSVADSFWMFVPAMILFGAGEAFRSGTHKSMIMQHLDLEGLSHMRVHYYGRTRSMSRLGSAVVAPLAAAVVFFSGTYRFIFLATIVPYVFGLLLMLTYSRELDGKVAARFSFKALLRHTAESFKAIWHTRELTKVLLNASAANSFFKVAKDYLQPILRNAATAAAFALPLLAAVQSDESRAAVLIGAVYLAIHLNSFASSRSSGRFADKIGHLGAALNLLLLIFAAVFCLVGVFLQLNVVAAQPLVKHGALVLGVLGLFLFYTLHNLRMPIVTGFLSDKTKAQQRATVLSVHSQLRAVMAAVIAPTFGVIADNLGIPFVFLIGGPVLLGAGLILRLEGRRASQEKPLDSHLTTEFTKDAKNTKEQH